MAVAEPTTQLSIIFPDNGTLARGEQALLEAFEKQGIAGSQVHTATSSNVLTVTFAEDVTPTSPNFIVAQGIVNSIQAQYPVQAK